MSTIKPTFFLFLVCLCLSFVGLSQVFTDANVKASYDVTITIVVDTDNFNPSNIDASLAVIYNRGNGIDRPSKKGDNHRKFKSTVYRTKGGGSTDAVFKGIAEKGEAPVMIQKITRKRGVFSRRHLAKETYKDGGSSDEDDVEGQITATTDGRSGWRLLQGYNIHFTIGSDPKVHILDPKLRIRTSK